MSRMHFSMVTWKKKFICYHLWALLDKGSKGRYCRLKKAIYGLKQSPQVCDTSTQCSTLVVDLGDRGFIWGGNPLSITRPFGPGPKAKPCGPRGGPKWTILWWVGSGRDKWYRSTFQHSDCVSSTCVTLPTCACWSSWWQDRARDGFGIKGVDCNTHHQSRMPVGRWVVIKISPPPIGWGLLSKTVWAPMWSPKRTISSLGGVKSGRQKCTLICRDNPRNHLLSISQHPNMNFIRVPHWANKAKIIQFHRNIFLGTRLMKDTKIFGDSTLVKKLLNKVRENPFKSNSRLFLKNKIGKPSGLGAYLQQNAI